LNIKQLPKKSVAIIIFLLIWECSSIFGLTNPVIIPPPSKVAIKLIELIVSGELFGHILTSMERVFIGFGLSVIVALPLGFLLGGWFRTFEEIIDPLLQVLGQINPFTLFPVFIALLGIGEVSKIAIIYWVCQWPILFNTVSGIRNVDPLFIKMARSIKLNKSQMFIRVLVPAALPSILTGIRMSAVFSLFMLIGAEMIGSQSGLGFMIIQAQSTFQMTKMYAGVVTVAILGILVSNGMTTLEKFALKWKEEIMVQ
jgi:NitT/TauT family transport system permease protein